MRALSHAELRKTHTDRHAFAGQPRRPHGLVLDGLKHHGNVGSLFRLADSLRLGEVLLDADTPSPETPAARRVARGVQQWVPWTREADLCAALKARAAHGARIVALELTDESLPWTEWTWEQPTWLVLGNEDTGVSQAVLDLCHGSIHLPMAGMGSSLNVVVAASAVLFDMARQCGASGFSPGSAPGSNP